MAGCVIVPGFGGLVADRWRGWWRGVDPDAAVVEPPHWSAASLASWCLAVRRAILSNPGCVAVGHGLGAVVLIHLSAREPSLPVRRALLVSPADVDGAFAGRPEFHSFTPLPDGPLGWPVTVTAAQEDPWIAPAAARSLAARLGAAFEEDEDAGYVAGPDDPDYGRRAAARLAAFRTRPLVGGPLSGDLQ
jgi:predicted alpha/beta hydrolase family esterase